MGFALGAQGPFHSSIEPSTTIKRLISSPQHFTSAAFDQTQHLTNTTFAKLAPLARYSTSMTSPDERIIMVRNLPDEPFWEKNNYYLGNIGLYKYLN